MDNPIAWLVRHGDTKLTDSGVIISRTDVLPNEEGDEQTDKQLDFLSQYDIVDVYASPLIRCVLPATRFADGRVVSQDRGLLPWDRGILTGVLSDEAEGLIKLLLQNPDVCIPHGESRNEAEDRIWQFFEPALSRAETSPAVFFTHHTVIDFLAELLSGERTDDPPNIVEVGGVAAVYLDGDGYRLEAVLNPAQNTVAVS